MSCELATFSELDSNRAIAREITRAREHQVSHSRETRERDRMTAARMRELCDLGERPRVISIARVL